MYVCVCVRVFVSVVIQGECVRTVRSGIDKASVSLAGGNCQGGSKEHYLYFASAQHLSIHTHTQSKEMLHIPA